jgi:type I restriction-modification system DNA methylase subunit
LLLHNKLSKHQGFIDLFWPGQLLVEHKSLGKDLEAAFEQAADYFAGLTENEIPKYVLVSDFARFRLYDLDEKTQHEFDLADLHQNIKLFGFIAGYQKRTYKDEDAVNVEAAYQMGKLHDQLEAIGYTGHHLEVYLVRLLFCLFADDTGIFEKDAFKFYIEERTNEDGSDLALHLANLFQVLNTAQDKRFKNLDDDLKPFPYINGHLFTEALPFAQFDSRMRQTLLDCCSLDWGLISPAVFGAMFQSIMDQQERRELGAHYTSEKNILKLIKPLFLDELWEEFDKLKHNKKKLQEFHKKLGNLKFLDPACGCGNFLVITYRELRLLELEVLRTIYKGQMALSIEDVIWVNVDQFYGIEIDEWPARIAEVALWLMDHQMNMRISEEFGEYFSRLPLTKSATIVNANALRIDWQTVVPKTELNYILGNPPFIGKTWQSKEQKDDLKHTFSNNKGIGSLDYVCAWYMLSVRLIQNTSIQVAFVSTNSIAQGEQVSTLWNALLKENEVFIQFAHRTFKWKNEAKGKAAVHVVILGLGTKRPHQAILFDYEGKLDEAEVIAVNQINPYLVNGENTTIGRRTEPICNVPKMNWGNKPVDGGHLILDKDEYNTLMKFYPEASKYLKSFLGGREFLQNRERWCFWLVDVPASEIKKHKFLLDRIEKVKNSRMLSKDPGARNLAATPYRFRDIENPSTFLAVPEVSSERRDYIPIGFLGKDVIASNKIQMVPNANLWHFGNLTSLMHMTWMRYTCGRLESRYSYSNTIVYNNYPWPKNPTAKQKQEVEKCAQAVLDARAAHPTSSLADLYDPLTMPPNLVKAHQALDKAVDKCYRPQPFTTEMQRIEYLFGLYKEYTEPLLNNPKNKKQ